MKQVETGKANGTVRDRLWAWGSEAGTLNGYYNLPDSRMTPAETAFYLNVPNALMIVIGDVPAPPFDQHMIAFRPLRRVVWSVVGDSSSARVDLDEVLRLAGKFPNLCGAIMDDFFHELDQAGRIARVSVDELKQFRARLQATRPLGLWVTLYAHNLDLPVQGHLEQCDVATFWSWTADQLPQLETNFARLEKIAPGLRCVLGCYLWDYGASRPMPVEMMRHQCELGLQWLQAGRVEGLIFLSNSACDHALESVEWTRRWIAEVADQTLKAPS